MAPLGCHDRAQRRRIGIRGSCRRTSRPTKLKSPSRPTAQCQPFDFAYPMDPVTKAAVLSRPTEGPRIISAGVKIC